MIAGDHAADSGGGIVWIRVSVGAIEWEAIAEPANDGRVQIVKILDVSVGYGGVIDGVAEEVTNGGRVGVVVLVGAGLVGEGIVEGHAFVDVGVAVPDVIAINISCGAWAVIDPF